MLENTAEQEVESIFVGVVLNTPGSGVHTTAGLDELHEIGCNSCGGW